ncbi:MAG: SdpI family protein [Clostridiaceae bacterium]|nr:SdpI family protein [Clostridiaceae bacterium]
MNQDTWEEAQRHSAIGLMILGLIVFVEKQLRKVFNKDGSRKSK